MSCNKIFPVNEFEMIILTLVGQKSKHKCAGASSGYFCHVLSIFPENCPDFR